MGAAGRSVVLSVLLPVTVLQITLIHVDHAVPPRCINVLDLRTQYGECAELLRSGVFTCEADFCPECESAAHKVGKAHQCDLTCGFCPEPAQPCPEPEESAPCANRLDIRCELCSRAAARVPARLVEKDPHRDRHTRARARAPTERERETDRDRESEGGRKGTKREEMSG